MISKTTKKDDGWYYTFRKRNDGTVIIIQKNTDMSFEDKEIHIWGEDVLSLLKEVVNADIKEKLDKPDMWGRNNASKVLGTAKLEEAE